MKKKIKHAFTALLICTSLISCTRTLSVLGIGGNVPGTIIPTSEFRGVWLRPPSDTDQIPVMLERIEKAGFNAVFLETMYHGFVIYPGSNFPQRPEYRGKDVLRIFLHEAHKRQIAVHCWTEVFYWQVDTEKYPKLPHSRILDENPSWRLLTAKGETSDVSENAHIFADPSNPSVQAFLLEFYRDLVTRYNIDGVNLDYIRYSAGEIDTGYTAFARKAFERQTGVDPVTIDREKKPDLWMKWVKWREDQVSGFVGRASCLIEEIKPDIMISAAIFSGYYNSRGNHPIYQDWASWIEREYIDVIIPMAYGPNPESIRKEINEVAGYSKGKAFLFPALAISITKEDSYGGAGHPPMDVQVQLVRSMGLKGHSVFCYGWILKNRLGFNAFREVYGGTGEGEKGS